MLGNVSTDDVAAAILHRAESILQLLDAPGVEVVQVFRGRLG
jgi:hypothetical protein